MSADHVRAMQAKFRDCGANLKQVAACHGRFLAVSWPFPGCFCFSGFCSILTWVVRARGQAFLAFDDNNDGQISSAEFRRGILALDMKVIVTKEMLQALFTLPALSSLWSGSRPRHEGDRNQRDGRLQAALDRVGHLFGAAALALALDMKLPRNQRDGMQRQVRPGAHHLFNYAAPPSPRSSRPARSTP